MCVGVYPVWEGRKSIRHTLGGIWRDLRGRGRGRVQEGVVMEGSEGYGTPVEGEKEVRVGVKG